MHTKIAYQLVTGISRGDREPRPKFKSYIRFLVCFFKPKLFSQNIQPFCKGKRRNVRCTTACILNYNFDRLEYFPSFFFRRQTRSSFQAVLVQFLFPPLKEPTIAQAPISYICRIVIYEELQQNPTITYSPLLCQILLKYAIARSYCTASIESE